MKLLEATCKAMGWQGGTLHQALQVITTGDKYNVRRYGKETYYTKDVLCNGQPIGTIDAYHSEHQAMKSDRLLLFAYFKSN